MLSRVADSIFWMSRYIERAENVARFVEVNFNLALDLGIEHGDQWLPLISTTGDHDIFADRYGTPNMQKVVEFLTFDDENPNSIISCLRKARENARAVREMISSAMWEELNKFYLMVRGAATGRGLLDTPLDFFHEVKMASHLLQGVTDATMSHNEAWHFARMARLLERADKTSRILDVKYYLLLPSVNDVGTPIDTIQWAALLKSASALEMYRKAFGRITPEQVAEFLLLDKSFPRAVHFCMLRAEESLLTVTGSRLGTFHNQAEQRLGRLRADLDYTSIKEIISIGMHEFIDRFQTRLNDVGESIYYCFLSPEAYVRNNGQVQSQSQIMGMRY
ncbi:MAG: alpha-E domain-containing protein [Pirellulales bacterium]|nr:alpha-E domain-containing protein [Pirellulales bacterium]